MDFGCHLIPCDHVIVRTRHSYVFTNIRPFLPMHILVSPISKKERLYDLSSEETSDLFNTARIAMKALRSMCDGFTLSVQDGPCAGQSVHHVHVHIVPRIANDLERNDDIYAKGALDSASRPSRSYEDMEKQTKEFRQIFRRFFESENIYYEMDFE
ncbi:fragile histidine family hydrolase [Ordospora colligata]|uniref:Fragile histidine family hydrolase n=1 Tax=Ordospora colligata OC4 TaxID=1354746 RepID=A0A0B2UK71_9MICR|nr:fragile histidine family hydrolase [Ordospora colligata OC4]KHN69634.1 fragile histidine family hydrolase [Ordospora colligata OC4]TBU15753.1 fragile histidine family hydrolase [Ordospora colligata]TBU15881.1 fragile histidine family hydrolase [Ordospora colligata]TBU18775.1 fragile histidine family hydrolase [Ordospora colligata]